MKKNKIVIMICILLFLLCLGIGCYMIYDSSHSLSSQKREENTKQEDKLKNDNNSNVNDESQQNGSSSEDTKKDSEVEENIDNQTNLSNKENEEKDNTTSEGNSTSVIKQETPSNNDSSQKQPTTPKKENQPQQTESVEAKQPWTDLGISEYDYYNKPMWSWAKVDFSITDYGTKEATEQACQKKGAEYEQQGYAYGCTPLNSYSGKYLGEMLELH